MNDLITNQEKLETLAEEIKAILVEGEFSARWLIVETYHNVGKLILENLPNFGEKAQFLSDLSNLIGRSERTLYRAMEFAEKFPDLSLLPEGKNISFNKIITKYLSSGEKEDKECEHEWIEVCRFCGKHKDGITT